MYNFYLIFIIMTKKMVFQQNDKINICSYIRKTLTYKKQYWYYDKYKKCTDKVFTKKGGPLHHRKCAGNHL
jgi:hypothetical protein